VCPEELSMPRKHGAREQKRAAKQKAKRREKRSDLVRRTSTDPTVRLQNTEKWPVVQALVGADLWDDGIGYLLIARQQSGQGDLVFATYLVDVFCLGVKDAFWRAGSLGEFKEMVRRMESTQTLVPIDPACLVKIVQGAVEYARSFGFPPHPDYRHAAMLLAGIDPAECPQEFTFGRDGKPFYIQGPHESLEEAMAISERLIEAGGHYMVALPGNDAMELIDDEDFIDEDEDEDDLALPAP
jgi:hypothetical protein